jgi:hypothetical protein
VRTKAGEKDASFRIETRREARKLTSKRAERLPDQFATIADAIENCDGASECCLEPLCAVCARTYRAKLIPQLMDLADTYEGPHRVLTIHLEESEAGFLSEIDLKHAHDALRKRFNRLVFQGAILAGGTEVAWKSRDERWILHVHLLAIGISDHQWRRLRRSLRDSAPGKRAAILAKRQTFENKVRHASYLQKFGTYHRPGEQNGFRRPRAIPLPQKRFVELVSWWDGHRFGDFLFLYGARRRGGRIVPEHRATAY